MSEEVGLIMVLKNEEFQYLMYVTDNDPDDIELMLREHVAEKDEDYDKDHYSWKFDPNY